MSKKDEVQEVLFELFAAYYYKEVNSKKIKDKFKDKFDIDNYKEILELPGFREYFAKIRENKALIEKIENDDKDSECQARASLWAIYNKRKEEGVGCEVMFVNLLKRTLYKSWGKNVKDFFEIRYEMITKWSDFFISYTNRNAAETNFDFKTIITHTRGKFPNIERRKKENFVAKLIAKCLRQNNLSVYFDADVIKCGDDIEDNVRDWCRRSYSFVQLVEHITFHDPGNRCYNWCFEEYSTFKGEILKRQKWAGKYPGRFCFFITCRELDDIKPAQMPTKYQVWYKHISDIRHISLEGVKIKKVRLEISKIARDIINDKKKFIASAIESEIDAPLQN